MRRCRGCACTRSPRCPTGPIAAAPPATTSGSKCRSPSASSRASFSLVITRDDEGDTPEKKKKNWRVQFAVNASVIGEVGAEVGLLGGRTNVVLSAAEPDTAEALDRRYRRAVRMRSKRPG